MVWTVRVRVVSEGSPVPGTYLARVVESELRDLLTDLPAVSLDGPRGVGKTATASRLAATIHRLDDHRTRDVVDAQIELVTTGPEPILIDEWQLRPSIWNVVRRAVDDDGRPGRFILTGSAAPKDPDLHSGAGRIVTLRMRPLSLSERSLGATTVSLRGLLEGDDAEISGTTEIRLGDYVDEILASGFPALRHRRHRAMLDSYLDRVVDTDVPGLGTEVRHPATLRRWMAAYAASTATTTSYERIRDAATAGDGTTPAKTTTIPYREALERIRILEPLPAWAPTFNHLARLTAAPKHHLADPALAARLCGVGHDALVAGRGPVVTLRDGPFVGALFESLATLEVRVHAQAAEARVFHFRTMGGEREIDLIVERDDHRVVAIEVKLSATVDDHDVRHLLWLRQKIGDHFLDGVVLTTGTYAYRRQDGIAVVPLALLGP